MLKFIIILSLSTFIFANAANAENNELRIKLTHMKIAQQQVEPIKETLIANNFDKATAERIQEILFTAKIRK